MFRITEGKGFHMTFANGNTISVQFGKGNYCSRRFEPVDPCIDRTCPDAEVLAWDANNNDLFHEQGYLTTDEIAALIGKVARGEPI